MSRATPQMRTIAMRLIVHEARGNKPSVAKAVADLSTCEKLRPHLATLVGNGGYHALLSRALVLAQAEVPWLRAVRVKAEGTLEGVEQHHAQLGPDKFFEGRVVLFAQLLGLLVAFIGENLTLGLVREVWPNATLDGLAFATERKKNAKRK
jgi:hypothetical protein